MSHLVSFVSKITTQGLLYKNMVEIAGEDV